MYSVMLMRLQELYKASCYCILLYCKWASERL